MCTRLTGFMIFSGFLRWRYPPNHTCHCWIFHYTPLILGYHLWKRPVSRCAQTWFGDHPFLNLADILAGQSIDECSAMCEYVPLNRFFFDLGESSFLFPLNGHVVGLFPIFRHSHVTIISWIWFGDSGCGMMKLAIKMSRSDS